jgi:hypothetical protein
VLPLLLRRAHAVGLHLVRYRRLPLGPGFIHLVGNNLVGYGHVGVAATCSKEEVVCFDLIRPFAIFVSYSRTHPYHFTLSFSDLFRTPSFPICFTHQSSFTDQFPLVES